MYALGYISGTNWASVVKMDFKIDKRQQEGNTLAVPIRLNEALTNNFKLLDTLLMTGSDLVDKFLM